MVTKNAENFIHILLKKMFIYTFNYLYIFKTTTARYSSKMFISDSGGGGVNGDKED